MSDRETKWWCGATRRLFIDGGMAVHQGTKAKVVSEKNKKCFSSDCNLHFLLKCSTQGIKSFFFLEVSKHKDFWIAEMLLLLNFVWSGYYCTSQFKGKLYPKDLLYSFSVAFEISFSWFSLFLPQFLQIENRRKQVGNHQRYLETICTVTF